MNISDLSQQEKNYYIEQLEKEAKKLPAISMFGDNNHLEQYPMAIEVLRTGCIPKEEDIDDNHDLLYTLCYDLDMFMCNYQQ